MKTLSRTIKEEQTGKTTKTTEDQWRPWQNVPAHNKLVEKHAVPFSDLFFEMIPRDFYDCFSICQSTISVLRSNRKASGDYWFTSFLSN